MTDRYHFRNKIGAVYHISRGAHRGQGDTNRRNSYCGIWCLDPEAIMCLASRIPRDSRVCLNCQTQLRKEEGSMSAYQRQQKSAPHISSEAHNEYISPLANSMLDSQFTTIQKLRAKIARQSRQLTALQDSRNERKRKIKGLLIQVKLLQAESAQAFKKKIESLRTTIMNNGQEISELKIRLDESRKCKPTRFKTMADNREELTQFERGDECNWMSCHLIGTKTDPLGMVWCDKHAQCY